MRALPGDITSVTRRPGGVKEPRRRVGNWNGRPAFALATRRGYPEAMATSPRGPARGSRRGTGPARAPRKRAGAGAPRATPAHRAAQPVGDLAFRLLHDANSGLPRIDYLGRLLTEVLESSGADGAALWLREGSRLVRCGLTARHPASFRFSAARDR